MSPRDYRAWYGLGQTYEIIGMHFYALHYYQKATTLRPYDSRMWVATAACYEKLERWADAIRAYEVRGRRRARAAAEGGGRGFALLDGRAFAFARDARATRRAFPLFGSQRAMCNNDPEGHATVKLATLHKMQGDRRKAAQYFQRHVDVHGGGEAREAGPLTKTTAEALLYLAHYHKDGEQFDSAIRCCSRLLEFNGPERDEAKVRPARARAARARERGGGRGASLFLGGRRVARGARAEQTYYRGARRRSCAICGIAVRRSICERAGAAGARENAGRSSSAPGRRFCGIRPRGGPAQLVRSSDLHTHTHTQ